MALLEGEQVNINTPSLKNIIGKKVQYILFRDIDNSGRGYFTPRQGIIDEVYRRHVIFSNGNTEHFSQIKEIVFIP